MPEGNRRWFMTVTAASAAALFAKDFAGLMISPAEGAEVKQGMTWDAMLDAVIDDMEKGKVEQAMSVVRFKDGTAFVFRAQKGLVASVPLQTRAEDRALQQLFAKHADKIDRIGSLHQHQLSAIRFSRRSYPLVISEVDESGKAVGTKDLTNSKQSAPFSLEDMELSVTHPQYGLLSQDPQQGYSVVHGVFDPFGGWYYETVTPETLAKISPRNREVYAERKVEAERFVELVKRTSDAELRELLQQSYRALPGGQRVVVHPKTPRVQNETELYLAMFQLGNRGFFPVQTRELGIVMEKHTELKEFIAEYIKKQRLRITEYGKAREAFVATTAFQGGPPTPQQLEDFYDATYDAFGFITRFIQYDALRAEKPLSGVWNN
ncbi:MAG: hypothetical protein RI911_831 [Candidatus Parcubacteria bacterium]|jgi:hypothetical protein